MLRICVFVVVAFFFIYVLKAEGFVHLKLKLKPFFLDCCNIRGADFFFFVSSCVGMSTQIKTTDLHQADTAADDGLYTYYTCLFS